MHHEAGPSHVLAYGFAAFSSHISQDQYRPQVRAIMKEVHRQPLPQFLGKGLQRFHPNSLLKAGTCLSQLQFQRAFSQVMVSWKFRLAFLRSRRLYSSIILHVVKLSWT